MLTKSGHSIKPLPKAGTAARAVVDLLLERDILWWSEAEGVYRRRLRELGRTPQRQHTTMNLSRILRKYGHKTGKRGSRAPWKAGDRFPTPGTFYERSEEETKKIAENELAREWLIVNDPEAADFWRGLPSSSDFIEAKRVNIRDFGKEPQVDTSKLPPVDKVRGFKVHGHTVLVAPAEACKPIEKPYESKRTRELREAIAKAEQELLKSEEEDKEVALVRKQVASLGKQTLLFLRTAIDERLEEISAEVIR